MTHWQSTPSITYVFQGQSSCYLLLATKFKLHSGSLIELFMKISTTKTTSYMVGQHVCRSLRIISLIKVWTCDSSMQQFIILIHGNRQLPQMHTNGLLRSFSWMMMTASLWLMEMLTPCGCTLLTTKLIVKFSAGSGSLSSTITILKQPLLFPNKTVTLRISKFFSAVVSEVKRTEVWKTYGYILLLQVNMNYFRGTYSLNYLNRHLKTIFFY